MNIISKYTALALATMPILSACTDDDDNFAPGEPYTGAYEIYFSSENSSYVNIAIENKSFNLTLIRKNSNTEVTVPISTATDVSEYFEIPTSVTFASGDTTATLQINVTDNVKIFTSYNIELIIAENYYNPYSASAHLFDVTVVKEDYADVYTGTYVSEFWEEEWETSIQYSELLGLYRIKDWIIPNYTFYFSWDKETNKLTPSEDEFAIGWEYGDYGMVYAVYNSDYDYYYNPDEQVFSFTFDWAVSAGTLGTATEEFHIAK